jgi:hypothetical protein
MARSHRFRLVVFSAASLIAVSRLRADTDPATRPVIRGTGKDVQIVYRAPRTAPAVRLAADPVADALEQKRAGAMPDIVGAGTLRRFRQAGAGDSVIAFLSANAAVDIGVTAEDAMAVSSLPAMEGGGYGDAYPDLVSSGYPFYGGYGGGYAGNGWGMRRGFFKGNHAGFGGGNRFFFRFGNGFGNGFGPRPHPLPASRGGAATHGAVARGGRR